MKLVNLTPHPIVIMTGEEEITIEPEGTTPRLVETVEPIGSIEINGIEVPLVQKGFGRVEGLPEPKDGTLLIVSSLVASAARERNDLIVPRTVRDESGRVIGCDGFFKIK